MPDQPTPEQIRAAARDAAQRHPSAIHALTPTASMRARPAPPEGCVFYTVWGSGLVRSSDAGWRAAGVETICLLERVRRG